MDVELNFQNWVFKRSFIEIILFSFITKMLNLGVRKKNPKKPNRTRNQTEIEPKNKLIKPIDSIFVVFYTNLDFSFNLHNTKNVVSINRLKNKNILILY